MQSVITILSQEVALKNKILSAAVVALLVVATSLSLAGGYQVNEHGARAMGMGGAFVALASDASAVFFNPAGLAYQSGINVLVGGTAIMPATSFTSATPSLPEQKMKSQTFFPPNVYISYAMDDLTFAVGVFAPYGLGTEWEPTWSGRHSAVKTDLQAIYINPSVAYRVNDQFSVGVGASYIIGKAKLNRKQRTFSTLAPPTPSASDGEVNLEGDGTGFSINAGVLYKASSDLTIGASYRHLAKVKFEGDVVFSNMQALTPYFPGGKGSVELPMPSNMQAGLAYNLSSDLTVALDFQYVLWSAYEKLTIVVPTGPAAPAGLGGQPLQATSTSAKDWENAMLIRVGGEYRMDKLTLRAGFIYDATPQPDKSVEPMLPDANRIEFTVGAGYMLTDMISVDAAYQFISSAERTGSFTDALGTTVIANYTGNYKSTANLLGINIGLRF